MRSVWSLTKLVVRESIRKRLLLLLGVTCAVVLLVPLMLPATNKGEMIQVAQSWLLSSVTFFGIVGVLFISGTSLPGDLKEGRLFLLFTKPVHRSTYILSKFLGFSLVFFLFVSVAGGTGYVMLLMLSEGQPVLLSARKKISSNEFKFNKRGEADTSTFRGGMTKKNGEERFLVYGTRTTSPIAMWEFRRKPDQVYRSAPTALLDFKGRKARRNLSVDLRFYVKIPVEVSPDSSDETRIEWRRVQRKVMTVRQNQIARFQLLPDRYETSGNGNTVFDEVNRFRIVLSLTNPASVVSFHRNSVQISGPEQSYLINYLKALFMIFLLLVLISAFMTAVTTVLSGPISICLGLLFYMIGSMTTFLQDALSITRSTIESRRAGGPSGGHSHLPHEDVPTWAMEYSSFVINNLMAVIPNFEQFSQQVLLMQGWEIPISTIYTGLRVTMPSILLFLVVGAVLFQLREISS